VTTPPVPPEAIALAEQAVSAWMHKMGCDSTGCFCDAPEKQDFDLPLCILDAVAPAIRAAERERIWSRPVTQRLELHEAVWRCAGCLAELTESVITHLPRCGEMGALLDGEAR
jgi:hypothetical protein